ILFAGTLCAGIGFGPAFSGAFKALTAVAPADQRSGLVAVIYLVCYIGLSLPAIAAGIAVRAAGLTGTTAVYGIAIILLAGTALIAYPRNEHRPRHEPCTPLSCPGTTAPHHTAAG
ncbi:MAG: hypothetical protein J2P20_17945, partial [Pseudonocardia sp.]|nr:hypothetical protein [Pseudonocardia sp.]